MIKCGHCGRSHGTVADVKACSTGGFTDADEREMQRMEAEGDRAETRRDEAAKWAHKARVESAGQRQVDMAPASAEAIHWLRELMATKVAPEHEKRYAAAVNRMLAQGQPSGYAVRSAIARVEPWQNVRAGGGYSSASHTPDAGRWSAADRERAQFERGRRSDKPVDREGLYRLSRDVRLEWVTYPKGTLFQVTRSRDTGRCSAKRVDGLENLEMGKRPTLTYVKGMIFNLLDAELVPVEEAEEITRKTGWCIFGHYLTNPKSIARGMGPKCYERYPHLARNAEEAA